MIDSKHTKRLLKIHRLQFSQLDMILRHPIHLHRTTLSDDLVCSGMSVSGGRSTGTNKQGELVCSGMSATFGRSTNNYKQGELVCSGISELMHDQNLRRISSVPGP